MNSVKSGSVLELVRKAYPSFTPSGIDQIQSIFADNVSFVLHGDQWAIPHAGEYQGVKGIRRFCNLYECYIECFGDGPSQFVNAEDHVIVKGFERSRVRATGVAYHTSWLHWIRIKDGKIARWEEFLDTQAVAMAFRRPPKPTETHDEQARK